jgi:predicted O-linked N-acetylglucosamine transferase (SPINDLY family)
METTDTTTDTESLLRQAIQYHRRGQWPDAEPIYREALNRDPNQPDVLHLLGVLANQTGRPEAAAGLIRQAIALDPGRVEFHNSLGNALRAGGDLRSAAGAFEHALSLDPRSAEVFTNLGALMEQAGNVEDATLCFLRALEINPDYGDAHYTLANLLKRAGNLEEAVRHYEQAIHPQCEYAAEALNNLGTTLRRMGRSEEAVERFRQAIRLRAPYFEAHLNLADALESAGKLEEAGRTYQAILSFQPDSAMAYAGAAAVLADQGRPERAQAAYRKAVSLARDNALLHSNLLLDLHYDATPDPSELLSAHQEWAARHAAGLCSARPFANSRDPMRTLRVGFISADFCRHPIGFFLAPVLASRMRPGFELFCYSDTAAPDAMTAELEQGADIWRTTAGHSNEELAEVIREDRIDILVDLAGHTRRNRLLVFARKPAPVQMTWAGYPDTTGLPQMDWLLSDRWQTPAGSEQWFVERIARMPDGYVCYQPPDYAPAVSAGPIETRGHITFGCCNRLAKVNAEVVRLWARLLYSVPEARLVLQAYAFADKSVSRRYRKMFSGEGIDGSRLELQGPRSHGELLAGYADIDIALDPFPYSGGLTTCEALWMGVPVITWAGERMASRHSAGHLTNIGLPELVASSADAYLRVATELALDGEQLHCLRRQLRERMACSPLVDGERFTANLLALWRRLWTDWCGAS